MKKILYSLMLLLCISATLASASAEAKVATWTDFENGGIIVEGETTENANISLVLFKPIGGSTLTAENTPSLAEHITFAQADQNGNFFKFLPVSQEGVLYTLFAESGSIHGAGTQVYYPILSEFNDGKEAVNNAVTASDMKSALETHARSLGVSIATDEYTKNTDEFCKTLLSKRPSGGWQYISDYRQDTTFRKDFTDTEVIFNRYLRVLADINNATRESLTTVITNYNDILELTTEGKYSTYSYEINKLLVGRVYESLDDFKSAFQSALSGYTPSSLPSGGSSGGGGNRGGSVGSVVVEYQKSDESSEAFSDLESVLWAKESILILEQKGIISGMGNGIFMPEANVTREQFVKMLLLALELPTAGNGTVFSDVSESDWFAPYVMSAYELGVVTGKDDGSYGCGEPITREAMAAMVVRAVVKAGKSLPEFADANYTDFQDMSDYAKGYIQSLGKAGIITGMPDGSFMPKGLTTRAQAAVVLYRLMQNTEG